MRPSAILFVVSTVVAAPVDPPAKPVDFNRDIRPILSDTCFACHGPDESKRMAGLRLDTPDGPQRVIRPGDAAQSKLFQRISAEKRALRMPPPGASTEITPQQIATIKRWIDEGAKSSAHWAYTPPRRPDPPAVANSKWPRNPIDAFVLARLEREGLTPSPEADRVTLLRRLCFDLTGLPPTLAEFDAFLKDKSPDAYEKQVDRLLASPHYGERMALQWLDLARYADTHGYHIDSHRDMWPWRDWVISAFNRNLPYDQFTRWQIAGDLLPNPTREQRIATGFNRNHMINFEGGAIPEEYLTEYIIDRVEATSTVWLGTTMGCARCHDHKYDPIRQRDFYRFYAFFSNLPEKGLDGRTGNAEPALPLPTEEQAQRLAVFKEQIAARQARLPESGIAARQTDWEKARLITLPQGSHEGITAHYPLDGYLTDISGGYRHGKVVEGAISAVGGQIDQAVLFDGQTSADFGNAGDFESGRPWSLALWVRQETQKPSVMLRKKDAAGRGWEITTEEWVRLPEQERGSRWNLRFQGDTELVLHTREPIMIRRWQHLAVVSDGAAIRVFLNGQPLDIEASGALIGSLRTAAPLITGTKASGLVWRGPLDDLRFYNRPLTASELTDLALHAPVRTLIETRKRDKGQNERLRDYYLTYDAPPEWRTAWSELKQLRAERKEFQKTIPTTMVMAEMAKPREAHILGRGDYRNPGEVVTPEVPAFLPPLAAGAPRNRLGLAEWLTDPAHPLTARVAVNRFWQIAFGLGLVKTTEDFGSQGDGPLHPELLDWLATEFVRLHWDVKALQKLILTSATYRQLSKVSPELRERDPENRLFARGPRFRLPAELVRDNALAVSGLLNDNIGGPSVFPYQPKGVWEELAYGDVFSAQTYVQSQGSDLYRRSMYTFWKRTVPPASLGTFDAPDREKCTARRAVTNTPLQALVLLNDPTYVEASRALAQKMLIEDRRDPIGYGFRRATGRAPASKERQVLVSLARAKLADYRRDKTAAGQLISVGESKPDARLDPGELAAYTAVASVILNLDETITKE